MKNYMRNIFLLILLICCGNAVAETQVSLPDDPQESFNYWKPFVIQAKDDKAVAIAHRVFDALLRTWDDGRISPKLNIVKSDSGPWAASLEDGNILLSHDVLNFTRTNQPKKFEHRLAFILAHELAHQRSNDLWHRKFFRLAGSQSPEVRQQILRGIDIDSAEISSLKQYIMSLKK